MPSSHVIVVLAAGQGLRFEGQGHKLTQRLGSSTVLGQTLSHALASRMAVVVVTTEALVPAVTPWVGRRDIVLMPEAPGELAAGRAPGMGSSLAAGVFARPQAPGWLVLPADMPLVQPETFRVVAAALAQHGMAYAQHRGLRGHPVGFAGEFFSELVQLRGDQGARRLLARYPAEGVEVDDPGVLADVDTQADLLAARRVLETAQD